MLFVACCLECEQKSKITRGDLILVEIWQAKHEGATGHIVRVFEAQEAV